MAAFQVTCITKPHVYSPHEHITHLGNVANGWRLSREDAINRIDNGAERFYVLDSQSGKTAYIGVVRELGKAPFLRTYADKVWNDNLLSLPQCPPNL